LLRGTAQQHRTGPSWASNDAPLKDLSNTRALKHLAPLATDYWASYIIFLSKTPNSFFLKCFWRMGEGGVFFVFGSTSIRSTVVTGQTEGFKVGYVGMGGLQKLITVLDTRNGHKGGV
jgi:hypothetical protein